MSENITSLRESWESEHGSTFEHGQKDYDICLRMHRALSWFERAEQFDVSPPDYSGQAKDDASGKMIFLWIALNAFYSKYEPRGKRTTDRDARNNFLRKMIKHDKHKRIRNCLIENKEHCDVLLKSGFLDQSWWIRRSDYELKTIHRTNRELLWVDADPTKLCEIVAGRIELLRAWYIHGMSTYASSKNVKLVLSALFVLRNLFNAVFAIIHEDGLWEETSLWKNAAYAPHRTLED